MCVSLLPSNAIERCGDSPEPFGFYLTNRCKKPTLSPSLGNSLMPFALLHLLIDLTQKSSDQENMSNQLILKRYC